MIRAMRDTDIEPVAQIHAAAFTRQKQSLEWIRCNFNAFPRVQYFVAEVDGEIYGYIEWLQKSGFRSEVVLELEQIAVSPDRQGRGIGTELIQLSFLMLAEQLRERGATIKSVIVTTRADNYAQRLYRSTLGAEVEATITKLYSADEVFMVARHIALNGITMAPTRVTSSAG